MRHVVIGAGEVGRAIAAVLSTKYEVEVIDIDSTLIPTADDTVIHVCFPFSDKFTDAVLEYQKIYSPVLTIIHSTVPVGTSQLLDAVHSPVTGRHPNLAESIRTFTKFFGGEDRKARMAAQIFLDCGVRPEIAKNSRTTEAGKLWQTLQYGWLIAMQKDAYAWMESVGADPKVAYDEFNKVYNEGYNRMGENFVLPILKDMPGPIGGHCVIPNTELLDADLAQLLRTMNTKWKSQN